MQAEKRVLAALFLLAILALVLGRLASLQPSDAVLTANQRATLEALTEKPRTPGSAAHSSARERIVRELQSLGIAVETQRMTSYSTHWGVPYDVARVENVVAKLEGQNPSDSVALLAHYDSVPHSKGAADDASGVIALLEAASQLAKGPKPRNNVVFLFSDAEEAGVLGSRAFVSAHPLFQGIKVALNFDARGGRGPLALVETSNAAGALVNHFANESQEAVASSVFPAVRRLLGSETDLAPFLRAGVAGMNFALADGIAHYHTPLDDASHLNDANLAQVIRQASHSARALGQLPLETLRPSELSYFDLPGLGVISYSKQWVLPLGLLSFFLCIGLAARAVRRGHFKPRQLLAASAGLLVSLAIASAMGAGLVAILRAVSPIFGAFRSDPAEPLPLRLALSCLALAVCVLAFRWLRARLPIRALFFGALLIPSLLGLAAAIALPGASYLFTLPLPFALVSESLHSGDKPLSLRRAVAHLALAIPALILLVPIPYLFFVALGVKSAMAPLAFVVLLLFLLSPSLDAAGLFRSAKPALAFLASVVVLLIGSFAANRFSAQNPRPSCLAYAVDADTKSAFWLSTDTHLSPGIAVFFPPAQARALPFPMPGQGPIRHTSSAPLIELNKPELTLLSDETRENARILRFHLRSPRTAPFVLVSVESKATILAGTIDGQRIAEGKGFSSTAEEPWGFTFQPMPTEGIEISMELAASNGKDPVLVRVIDRSYSLPEQALTKPLAADEMAVPFHMANSTFVSASFRY